LEGAQAALGHDPPDSGGGAIDTPLGEILGNAAVAGASAVAPEDSLNEVADLGVGDLGHGGCAGVVKAAASLAEHFTNLAHTGSVFPGYELDHRAAPGWGLVPRRADGDRASMENAQENG
jgi:hypothetical protein